ncbi:hypothetical protein BHE74_00010366 [Ensete ventricosum]|nr:hypothetical protein BHE74_00010366 [Ensete ventricosum]
MKRASLSATCASRYMEMENRPGQEEGLVEMVEDVYDDVVVGGGVDVGTGELAVDEDDLLRDAERRGGAVRDAPREEEVRVLCPDSGEAENREKRKEHDARHLLARCPPYARREGRIDRLVALRLRLRSEALFMMDLALNFSKAFCPLLGSPCFCVLLLRLHSTR